jgi:hypothetical protein
LVADPSLAGNPKLERLIQQYGEQACLCRAVSVVQRDLPLVLDWESSRYTAPAEGELYQLYSQLEFKTLLAKLQPPPDVPLFQSGAQLSGTYRSYVPSVDPPEFVRLAQELEAFAPAERVAMAFAGDAFGITSVAGQGVAFERGALAHDEVRRALVHLFEMNSSVGAYDAKRLLHALQDAGIVSARFRDDAMIAAHLLEPARGFADIEDAAGRFLAVQLPNDVAAHADATFQLIEKQRRGSAGADFGKNGTCWRESRPT